MPASQHLPEMQDTEEMLMNSCLLEVFLYLVSFQCCILSREISLISIGYSRLLYKKRDFISWGCRQTHLYIAQHFSKVKFKNGLSLLWSTVCLSFSQEDTRAAMTYGPSCFRSWKTWEKIGIVPKRNSQSKLWQTYKTYSFLLAILPFGKQHIHSFYF